MRIGIITQPLKANYGGVIQNWALQQVLKKLGHNPITIDYQHSEGILYWAKINIIRFVKSIFTPSIRYEYLHRKAKRPYIFESFVDKHINTTEIVYKYTPSLINKYKLDCIIIGSDQVWRPIYNHECLFDMYGQFVTHNNCKLLSYAASFGTNEWEYSEEQTIKCAQLIKRFCSISVRERGGVKLCKENFAKDATQVLDPTLLLTKEDYLSLVNDTPPQIEKPFLVAYILDFTNEIENLIYKKAEDLGLYPFIVRAGESSKLTPLQWISLFRDADYIITDSFHGSIFSLIFEKQFESLGNSSRGNSRFDLIKELIREQNIPELRNLSLKWLKSKLQ